MIHIHGWSGSLLGGLIVQNGVTFGLLNAVVAEDLAGPGRTAVTYAVPLRHA
jgi:hypothetical protein